MNFEPGLLKAWLDEDIQTGDLTTDCLIDKSSMAKARIVAKEAGVVCGVKAIAAMLDLIEVKHQCQFAFTDGQEVKPGDDLLTVSSSHATLLKVERTYLNLLQHLSGIATLTRQYCEATKHTRARIYDTRKTTPGLRILEKAAVKAGGGENHRIGLFDQILIKENHLEAFRQHANPFQTALEQAKKQHPGVKCIIEVQTEEEATQAAEGKPDVILLDNMDNTTMKAIVTWMEKDCPKIKLEASGGVNLESVRAIAETGVHRISVGALTHSAKNLDISMLIESES